MAQVDIQPQFGAELKDGFKPVNAWVSNGIEWLDEIQQFYRERSVIEKEYSAKLIALSKKYFERKTKKTSTLSVGDTPVTTPGSLESASMTTWTVQLTTLESRASEHDRLSSELISHLAEPLKILGLRAEELRKQHAEYAARLEKERDGTYGDLRKTKGRYDSTCQEVENRRKKVDSAFDYNKQKAQGAYQSQMTEMHNSKNAYLLTINVANKQKERYYNEYVPSLLDSLQDLSEGRVTTLNAIWAQAAQLEANTLKRSTEYMNHLSSEIPRNNPILDSMMFVRHNSGPWQEPQDFAFEPSPVWLDDDAMARTESAKTFLRNILVRSKSDLGGLRKEVDKKRKDYDGLKRSRQNVREGREKKDEMEVATALFALHGDLHESERKKTTHEVEVSTITTAVGDLSVGARSHNFKSQTFKIPTNCDLCGDRIWGLSAKGFECQDCGYACHSKCELKVPADCPGEQSKEERKKLKAQRQDAARSQVVEEPVPERQASGPQLERKDTVNSLSTLSSGFSANANRKMSTISQSTQGDAADDSPATETKQSLSKTGNRFKVPPPPAQYISPPSDEETDGSGGKKGRMLYDYTENGDGEMTVSEGKKVVIVEPDDGSGWIKVRAGGEEGLVPAAYCEEVANGPSLSDADRNSNFSTSSVSLAESIAGRSGGGKKRGPAVAPKRGARRVKHVEAMYEYGARSDAEHNMAEGERFVLVSRDSGDGWADVEKNGVTKSVPANYIKDV